MYIANSGFASDSTGTDIWYLKGSATKAVSVLWLSFISAATAAASGRVQLIRRSTVGTVGTEVADTPARISSDLGAPTAVVKHITVHASVLGTATATLWSAEYLQQAVSTSPLALPVFLDFRTMFGKNGLRINGVAEFLYFNVAAALGGSGNAWDINCFFEEH